MKDEIVNAMSARDFLSQTELMAAAAEECSKLVCSLLQLRRVMDDTNPIPVNYCDAVRGVNADWAGLQLAMMQLSCLDDLKIMSTMHVKNGRWLGKLIRKRKEEDELEKANRIYDKYSKEKRYGG